MRYGSARWRTVTSTWTIDVSHQLQFARGAEGRGNSSYTRDNCYWQIVMPVISHGGDRMDARSGPRNVSTFVPLLPRILSTRVCTKTRRVLLLENACWMRVWSPTWTLDMIPRVDGVKVGWKIANNIDRIYIRYKMLFKELINNEVVDLTNEIIDINIRLAEYLNC